MKLPPFGRELIRLRRTGAELNLFVHGGDHAWERARSRPPGTVLVLPPEEDFENYDWRCLRGVNGVTLVVWNRPSTMIDAFARELVHSGAMLVAALNAVHDGNRVVRCEPVFYRPALMQRAA